MLYIVGNTFGPIGDPKTYHPNIINNHNTVTPIKNGINML